MKLLFGEDAEREEQAKPAGVDILTKLIVPMLSVVAFIVALIKDHPSLASALVGIIVLSLAASFYPAVALKTKGLLNRRRDDRRAREALPGFRNLLRRFEHFVGYPNQTTDTLHEIARARLAGPLPLDRHLDLMPDELFRDLSYGIESRMSRRASRIEDLSDVVSELNLMVSYYCRYCACPIFDRFPQDLRPQLTDAAKRDLEEFRERFVRFLDDYGEFLKNLDQSLSAPVVTVCYFPRPKPLL